jgi:uncharacterized membrane protein
MADSAGADDEKETGRVEAFSDGVFAIAITLLVLDLKVPRELPEGTPLRDVLMHQWPSYLGFGLSFATIGIMWINHHRLFTLIRRVDHTLLVLNGLLLLGITVVPFPTSLLAEHIRGPDARDVVLIYAVHALNVAVFYSVLWWYATRPKSALLWRDADPVVVQAVTLHYRWGPASYLLSIALAWWNPWATLAVDALLALYFAIPPPHVKRLRRRGGQEA